MPEARQIVEEEVMRLPSIDILPDDLQPVFQRHRDSLVQLAVSLEAAGKDIKTIRSLVATLVKTYETDLLRVIEARL